ncbi:MAG: hypothetical protein HY327_03885 [Chloroflexi bacterium]|nr:hypothetical protein [Chloroflexota bacterium]
MKKATTEQLKTADDEMRPEYDFRGAVRGKFYKPLHEGYTVHIRKANGTTVVKHLKLEEGTVMLQPDVREYFPDSEAVNTALRSLITLMAQMPTESKSLIKKAHGVSSRIGNKASQRTWAK